MKKRYIPLIILSVLLIGAGCEPAPQGIDEATPQEGSAAGTQLEGTPYVNDTPGTPDSIPEQMEMPSQDAAMEVSGSFEAYSPEKLARAEEGPVVLAFLADWCPSCRAVENSITSQLDEIPADLTILKLDYDTETELKKKYSITTQHSFVRVDAEGNALDSWKGGGTLQDIIERVY